ncbi:MAG: hypothetical protein OXK80_01355, partial [Bdellovibrionales bacterium]|nr:hypothetical protein [Bdellovibrionales bacterium]
MATAEKLDGAITSGVNALETGARATGRVVADTARRVTPSEESRRRASETVRGAVSNAGQRLQTSAQQAREQQDRIREESHARHEARQSQKSSDQQTPGGTQELESNLFSNNGVLSTVFAWFNSRGSSQEESIPEAEEVTEGILSRSIEELNAYDTIVPLRTLNALKRANIYIIDSLVRKNRKELLDEKDVGPRSVEFIEEALELRGLFLGMTDTEIEDFNKAEAKTKTRIFYSLDEIRSAIAELNAQSPPAEQIINMKTYDMYRKRDSKLPPMGLIVRLYKEEYGITQGLSDFLFNR